MTAWTEHVKKTRDKNPSMSFKDALVEASKSYDKGSTPQVKRKSASVRRLVDLGGTKPKTKTKSPGPRSANPPKTKFLGGEVHRLKEMEKDDYPLAKKLQDNYYKNRRSKSVRIASVKARKGGQ